MVEGQYENGEMHGRWIRYDELGNLREIEFYDRGNKTGEWEFYDRQGSLVKKETH